MIGIIVILAISWLLLHFIQKQSLSVLGFWPLKKGMVQLVIGFVLIILIRFLFTFIESQLRAFEWTLNPNFQLSLAAKAFWYHLKSALTEELIYRGAALYILIQRIGDKKALWLSAIIFGVYHWFSYDLFGSGIVAMVYVLVITGLSGYVWAYTYFKTGSLMMPLGFHLGSNFLLTFYLPNQPYGELLYSITDVAVYNDWIELLIAFFPGLGPSLLTLFCVKFMLKRKLVPETNLLQH